MKKKALIYALLASVLVGTVASCDDKNNNNNNIVNVDPTPKEDPKKEEPDNPKKEEPETPKYNFEDNEESKKVYEEFSKYFTNVSYEDFLLNAKKSSVVGGILFEYKELSVTLNFDGSLKLKSLISVDGNKKTSTEYKYLNNEWVKTKETLTLNEKELITYSIDFKADDSYYGKDEYTYDENGNQLTNVHSVYENDAWIYYSKSEKTYDESGSALTLIESRYLNNEWVKILENKYINGEEKNIYSAYVDVDGKITGKNEYTYDENGNELSGSYFKYSNNEWIEESGFITINGERKRKRDVYYKDGILNQIHEYTYDENGNKVKEVVSSLINNEWIIISESKRINGELKPVLYYLFNDDGSFSSKTEQTYDEFGNTLTGFTLKYLNNSWINSHKFEYTYDASGKILTETIISYENNELDSKDEYVYDSNENEVEHIRSKYINNNWVLSSKYEYTYDENGSKLGNKEYIYLNNQWIKKIEDKYIEGKIKRVYSLNLNEDNTFNFKTEYTYDSKGNELSSISSSYKNNNWIISSKEEYEYDEAGNELGNKRYNYISNQWVKVYEDKYINGERKIICLPSINDNLVLDYISDCILDEDGKVIKYISIHIVDNELSQKIESTEDEYGYLNSDIYYDYDNGSWIATSKFEKKFDSTGNLLENIQYKSINGELKKDTSVRIIYKNDSCAEKEDYKYDETGKVLSITYSKYVNEDWTLDSKTEYTYDEKGKELTFDSYKYIKERWIRCSGYMFIAGKQKTTCNPSNDENGKLTDVTEYKYDDKASMISMTTIHFKDEFYDSKDDDSINDGKIVERVSSKYNGYVWVENKKIEYEYDTDGKQLYEAILVHINNGWIKTQVLTYINGNSYETYSATLTNAGYIDTQVETKYDTNGNQLSETTSRYINGKLEKILEYVFINEKKLISCKVDSNYTFKEEYEYDENGNEIVYIYSRMALNNWYIDQRREYKYHPNGQYSFTAIIKYEDNKYFSKEEIEQDEKGNVLNRITSQYENDAWNLSGKTEFDYSVAGIYSLANEYKFINGSWIKTNEEKNVTESDSKQIYLAYLNAEGKYTSEYFWEYYDNWNKKTYIRIEFKDGIYSTKNETTYDEIGNELIYDKYMYISNIWIKTYGYYYSSKEKITTCIMFLNEDGSYDRTINYLYENGILTRSVCVLFENNEVKEEVEYKYDENKNLMSETHSNLENGNWVYTSKDEHTYDSNGKELTKTHLKYTNAWIEEWKYEYTYDEYGRKETYYIYDNYKWVKVEPSSSENKVVHKKEDVQEGVYKTVDEVYDKNDKLISAIEIYYWNEKPSQKTEITYNDDENVAYAIVYNYVNDEWVPLEKYEFSYDEKGVSTGLIISNYVNDSWLYRTKQEYIYDENGNKIEEHDSKYVNGKWIVCEKLKKINGQEQLKLYYNLALNEDGSFNNQWESDCDENGNELLNIYQEYVNGEWVNKSKQECAYDENGNLLSTIYSVYINGAWNYKDKYEFTYDKDGNRTSEKKYSYQNGQWVLDEHN